MDSTLQTGLAPMVTLHCKGQSTDDGDDFLTEVLDGLARPGQKTLPCKYFYDQKGSALFDAICGLDEYYVTRTELALLRDHADDMAEAIGPGAQVVELGSGSSIKIRLLLDALDDVASYVPMDISTDHLAQAAKSVAEDYPDLLVQPVSADYTKDCSVPRVGNPERLVAFFPGSTIGNFTRDEALDFLKVVRHLVGDNGGLLIGVDLKKDKAILDAAYNDAKGVTAAFNRNLLTRINRELPAEIKVEDFAHHAYFNVEQGRIEMHLKSRRDQVLKIADRQFEMAKGETIHTENSYKYDLDEFQNLSQRAGFAHDSVWVDEQGLFSVHYLQAA